MSMNVVMANMLPVSSTNPPVLVGRRMSTGTRKRSLTRSGSASDGAAAEAAGVVRKSETDKDSLALMPIGVAYMERVSLDISVTKDASDKGGAVRYVMTVQQLGSPESWQHARTYDEYRSFQQRLLKAINLGHFCSAGCPWLFTFVKSYFPKKHLFNFTSTRVVTARRDALQRFFSTLQSFVLDRSNHCCAVVSHAIANELVCFIYGNHLDGASLDVFARDSGPAGSYTTTMVPTTMAPHSNTKSTTDSAASTSDDEETSTVSSSSCVQLCCSLCDSSLDGAAYASSRPSDASLGSPCMTDTVAVTAAGRRQTYYITTLGCGHQFHDECIVPRLNETLRCPTCNHLEVTS
ncbi:hypothetical protein ATCC90586_006774 [Pythium insidiosum]|nr:hypothetical protein ATCC90586_006774 [Pythium insidiosum]